MNKKTPLILNLNDSSQNDVVMNVSMAGRDTSTDIFANDVTLNMRFDNIDTSPTFFDDCGNIVFNTNYSVTASSTELRNGKPVSFFSSSSTSLIIGATTTEGSNSINHSFDGDFTIEMYVKFVDRMGIIVDFFSKRTNTSVGSWYFRKAADDKINFFVNSGQQNTFSTVLISATPIILNEWTHIAVVKKESSLSLFLNGVLSATTPFFGAVSYNTEPLRISSVSSDYFYGFVDDIRITRAARYTTNFTPPIDIPKIDVRCNIIDDITGNVFSNQVGATKLVGKGPLGEDVIYFDRHHSFTIPQ